MLINRLLIVGHGSIGKRHLRIARKLLPDADIRVLRHQESTVVPEFSNGCFSTIEEVLKFSPQVAVIASPATFHIDVALKLTDAGVHLLIEKPIAATLDQVPALLELSRKNKTVVLVGYNLRFLSSLQQFRSFVNNNVIGRVISVRCEIGQYLPSWRPDTDYRQGVSARRELGGGALLELSHEIDYLRWIFGEVEWVKGTLSRQSDLDIDVEDSAHLIMGFKSDLDNKQLIGTVNIDFIRHDTTRLCTAIGDKGSLRWNGLTGIVEQYDIGGKDWYKVFHHQHQSDDSYMSEWGHFLKCVTDQENPLISGDDGLKVLQIINSARQSSDADNHVEFVHDK